MNMTSNFENLETTRNSISPEDKQPDEQYVTMRSDQAWQLLDAARSQDPTRQTVLALALREAATIIIRASERDGVVSFPECIQIALKGLASDEAMNNQSKVVVLDQSQDIEPFPVPDLPMSA
jgi:hypothetical protein